MDNTKKRIIALLTILSLYAVTILSVLSLSEPDLYLNVIRVTALTGFVSLAISSVLSNYLREIRSIFGRPFLRVHHWFAAIGLILVTVHPVVVALYSASLLVFIPDFSSWISFWSLAGRPALYLVYAATLAAILRNRIKPYWRYIHGLMYVVLSFAFAHGFLIGANFSNILVTLFFLLLLCVVYILSLIKHYRKSMVKDD